MTMVPDNWGELLLPGLRKIYDDHKRKMPDYRAQLFNIQGSTKAQEFSLGIGALGTMDKWSESNNQVSYQDIDKGYKTTYTHVKYSKGVQIQRELVDDELYGEIKRRVRRLSNTVYYTLQTQAANVFNNAFDSTYTGGDAKPLCDDAHPTSDSSSQTNDNKGTYELTAANVETVRTAMMAWKDDKGNLIGVMPDMLLVPPALRKAAIVIADSDKEPDTSDNNVNVWRGSLQVIECPFLTDSNAWFLVDSMLMKENLMWYERRKPDFGMENDFDTEVCKYKTVGRWSVGWDSPLFLYGSNPS